MARQEEYLVTAKHNGNVVLMGVDQMGRTIIKETIPLSFFRDMDAEESRQEGQK